MGTPNTNPCGSIPHGDQIFFLSDACDETGKNPFL